MSDLENHFQWIFLIKDQIQSFRLTDVRMILTLIQEKGVEPSHIHYSGIGRVRRQSTWGSWNANTEQVSVLFKNTPPEGIYKSFTLYL